MPRILPRKFQGACLWLVSLNNNQTRAPSREGGENRGRIETLRAGDWAHDFSQSFVLLIALWQRG